MAQNRWILLLASLFFYLSAGVYGLLVVLCTSGVDFIVGQRIAATPEPNSRRHWLFVSLAVNLGTLAYFKYFGFFLSNANSALAMLGLHLPAWHHHVLLPVGLSYFTFSGISYVLDVYYRRLEPSRSAGEYLCYIAYFPKLLAGPIMRAGDFMVQLRQGMRATARDIETGAAYVLSGAVKKLLIADRLAGHVSLIFASPAQYDAFTLFQGVLGTPSRCIAISLDTRTWQSGSHG